eukprot:3372777-Rhodomonas_salina.4
MLGGGGGGALRCMPGACAAPRVSLALAVINSSTAPMNSSTAAINSSIAPVNGSKSFRGLPASAWP